MSNPLVVRDAAASPFYRGSLKAMIFDDQQRLLVVQTADDKLYEMPGGGWEHNESFEYCYRREIREELGVEVDTIGDIVFIYRGINFRGYVALRVVSRITLASHDFVLDPTDMISAKFVTRDELLALPMAPDEATIKDYVDQIWP